MGGTGQPFSSARRLSAQPADAKEDYSLRCIKPSNAIAGFRGQPAPAFP
jgi:hypothetical protein